MKLVRYESTEGIEVGVVDPDSGLVDALAGFTDALEALVAVTGPRAAEVKRLPRSAKLADLRLLPPVTPRRNIFCVGTNYHDHADELDRSGIGIDSYRTPGVRSTSALPIFTKATTSVIGDGDDVPAHPGLTSMLDYEAELAVVIGQGGRSIAREDALKHIAGYTIINDITARDIQQERGQWFVGKSLDGFCPMGPWLVSADEVTVDDMDIRCWVNGVLRQQANTRDLIVDVPGIVAMLSAGMSLQAGDIIATGTPGGVGIGSEPPRYLRPGDTMSIEITGLGRLTNQVGRPEHLQNSTTL